MVAGGCIGEIVEAVVVNDAAGNQRRGFDKGVGFSINGCTRVGPTAKGH